MISYSFHLSNKTNALNNINKLGQVSRHNLRAYANSSFDKDEIIVLRGSNTSILDSVKEIYHSEFDEFLAAYNKNKRSDRQIHDYLQHMSDSRGDVAAEIIIQIGDKDFWANTDIQKEKLSATYDAHIHTLEQELPNFKIASAVIHFDENSPHLHIVGIPIADGYAKGLAKQVAKTRIFTKDSLSRLQDTMRADMVKQLKTYYPELDFHLKDKSVGRNKDIPLTMMKEFDTLKHGIETMKSELQIYSDLKQNIASNIKNVNKPEFIIKTDTIKDGLLAKHEEHSISIKCTSRDQAQELINEISTIYDEHSVNVGISKTLDEHKNEIIEANRILESKEQILLEAEQLNKQLTQQRKKALRQLKAINNELEKETFLSGIMNGVLRFFGLPDDFYNQLCSDVREQITERNWAPTYGFTGKLADHATYGLLEKYYSRSDDTPKHNRSKNIDIEHDI